MVDKIGNMVANIVAGFAVIFLFYDRHYFLCAIAFLLLIISIKNTIRDYRH